MRSIHIYPGRDGWFYEVRLARRVVVFGWSRTHDGAHQAAYFA
jgi:hypothetical protein